MRRTFQLFQVLCLLEIMIAKVALCYPTFQRAALRSARRAPFVQSPAQFRCLTAKNSAGRSKVQLESTDQSTLDNTDAPTTIKNESEESLIVTNATWSRSIFRTLRKGAGAVTAAAGFISSSTTSVITDRSQYRRIKPSVEAFTKFLNTSGIDLELSSSLNYHLLRNVVVLSRVQNILFERNDRREQARSTTKIDNLPSREEAARYMRYATAAYGNNMIAAAEMDAKGVFDTRLSPVTRTRISEHIGVPEDEIVLMDVDYGNDINHLRHFVAVDHANKKVVLSIRGTFTLSEIVVDVAAFSRPCFGGEAHSEMYTMAERVWTAASGTVLNLLKENKGYEFIVTGHSLGAGCACLLNVMCHDNQRNLIQGNKMRCFAFASPPVFSNLDLIPEAVQSTTNYINEKDVVPFLSVDSVRHVFSSVRAIQDYMQNKMTRSERVKLAVAYTKPDEGLIEAVREATVKRLKPKEGAPVLAIPAAANVWMREQPGGEYDFEVCDSIALSKLGLNVDIRMAEDHFPSRYEHALMNLMDEI